jgi:predicted Zn-dependent protease
MKLKSLLSTAAVVVIFTFAGCKKDAPFVPFFSIADDKTLGQQVEAEIASKPSEYPVLDSAQYASIYAYIYGIRNEILNSGKIVYKDEFAWKIKVIKDDSTLNAFCTPGGYIYVYTGIMKYLDSKDQLAGVLGHEMAHADRRHTSRSLQAQYGVSLLLDVILGKNSEALKQIASGIYQLKNSREHESEADAYSVKYLCPTPYNAAGAAGFFQKMVNDGYTENSLTTFFSTHPSPVNRVQNINAEKTSNGCTGTQTYDAQYAQFKTTLP